MKKFCFKKAAAVVLLTVSLLGIITVPTFAAPYESYSYDAWDEEISAPVGYVAEKIITGSGLKVGNLNKPTDIYVDDDGTLYISDTGNNRLLIVEDGYKTVTVIDEIKINGKKQPLQAPGGLFVDENDNIYITQKELHRVIRMNKKGVVNECYEQPESNLLDDDFEFLPIKVVHSTNGSVMILSEGYFYGALTFDKNGKFVGFYGSNKVDVTVQVLADYAWKKILSKEQKNKMTRYVPVAYVSFDIDSENFVYTCTQTTKNSKNELRKLNALGNNVIIFYDKNLSSTREDYGDIKKSYLMGKSTDTQFVDICVDKNGVINGLDVSRGRIFQYDTEGRLLNIFGGSGSQDGSFATPAAIDDSGEEILVLDSENNSITVFSPTQYTKTLHTAVALYADGLYSEAKPYWKELLNENVNCEAAYVGLGRALYTEGDYVSSMKMARKGYDRDGYSLAFKAQRAIIIRKAFPIVATVLMIILACILVYVFIRLVIKKKPFVKKEKPLTPLRRIGRVMTHPLNEYYDIKDTNSWCLPATIVILLSWFAVTTMSKTMTGFIFNYHRPEDTNILYYFAATCVLYLLFVVINWGVTTLTDGKGNMYQIFIACSYALIPYVSSMAINIVMSNIFTADEAAFYSFINVIGLLWSAAILVGALRAIHDYSFTKTFGCIILTVLGIFFVIFLLVLFVSLVQQFTSFVASIFNELLYRS